MDLKKIFSIQYTSQFYTWIGHGLATAGAGLLFAVLGGLAGINPGPTFVLGTGLAAYYYVIKERGDKKRYLESGKYDDAGEGGVTPRVDRVGDLVGPLSVFAGSLFVWLLLVFFG